MKPHLFQFAAVTALAAGMALAQAPATGTRPAPQRVPFAHPVFGHEQMMQTLNLTTVQQQQANTIFGDARQKAEPIRQEMRQNREALHAAVKANKPRKSSGFPRIRENCRERHWQSGLKRWRSSTPF